MKKNYLFVALIIFILLPILGYAATQYDQKLIEKLKGKILLQVEKKGEAWYVNPVDGKRYYMKDGETAFQMLRKFGLGIKTVDLEKIPVGTLESNNSQQTTQTNQTNQEEKQATWKLTHSFTGETSLSTEPFMFKKGDWVKINMNYSSDKQGNFIVHLNNPATILDTSFLVNEITNSYFQDTNIYNKAINTSYYFEVKASGTWKIDVYEYLTE